MNYIFIDAIGACIEYFALVVFLWIFFEKNPRRTIFLRATYAVMPILFFLFSRYVDNIYLRPLLFIFCSVIPALAFTGPLFPRFFSVVLFQVVLILLEIGLTFLIYPLEGISFEGFYLFANITTKIMTLIVLWLLFLCSRKRALYFSRLPGRDIALLLLFPVYSLLLVSFSEYLIFLLNRPVLYRWGSLLVCCCIGLNIALYYLFLRLSTGEAARSMLQFLTFHLSRQKEYQEYLSHSYKKIHTLSHDMNRYLSQVYQLLQQNRVAEAMASLEEHQLEIAETRVFHTGYSLLDSVLDYKYRMAMSQSISMQVFWSIAGPIMVDPGDLAILLSNALDNAIEAAGKTDSPFISVHTDLSDPYLRIVISNPSPEVPEIINNRIASTKPDAASHGYGMESMHMLAEKYHGRVVPEFKDGLFILHVLLLNQAVDGANRPGKEPV